MNKNILVSINCIAYNHEKYIADAIESFIMQKTNFKFEILIGDDCSTDNTRNKIEKYIKQYPDVIRLISSEKNQGGFENIRKVHKESKGKYIAICEGDDYWTDPLKLQKQVDYMEAHPDCTLCFHTGKIVDMNKKDTGRLFLPRIGFRKKYYHHKNWTYSAGEVVLFNDFPTNSMLYPKSAIKEFPDWFFTAPAGDICIKFLTSSEGYAYYIDEPMCAYRYNIPTSVTNLWRKEDREKRLQRKIEWKKLIETFDEYSNYKHKNELGKAKTLSQIDILIEENRIDEIFLSEQYTEFLNAMELQEKAGLYVLRYYPNLYPFLKKVYKAIWE